MKSSFSIAVWMVLISVILRMIVFLMDWQFTNYEKIYLFGNLFVLMMGVFFSLRLYKRKVEKTTHFLEDYKAAMRFVGLYAILMSVFVYIYYSSIDVTYFDVKLKSQLTLAAEHGMDLDQVKKTGEMILTPFFQSTITLVGFIMLGFIYSAIIVFTTRKMGAYGERKIQFDTIDTIDTIDKIDKKDKIG